MVPRGGELAGVICLTEFALSDRRVFQASMRTSIFMRFDGCGCSARVAYVGR